MAASLVWRDLHLGDWMGLGSLGRPFDSVPEMDEELLGAWCRAVGEDDTVLVMGDVVVPILEGGRSSWWRDFPGGRSWCSGTTTRRARAVSSPTRSTTVKRRGTWRWPLAGEPPLILTHIPSRRFPWAR